MPFRLQMIERLVPRKPLCQSLFEMVHPALLNLRRPAKECYRVSLGKANGGRIVSAVCCSERGLGRAIEHNEDTQRRKTFSFPASFA
jgi:hypothetical protein